MKKNEKKRILILVVILAIAFIIFFAMISKKDDNTNENDITNVEDNQQQFYEELEDGTKLNTSTKLKETKNVEGLEIRNIQLTNKDNQTVLLAEVENKSRKEEDKEIIIDVTILDKQSKEIGTIGGMIAPLKKGEKTQLNISAMMDYANAYDFQVKIRE